MPTPKTHYRIALGEHNGEHSWIIHSAKGIKWHNIPDELGTLLQNLAVKELLDFSLGSDGRWYVRYRQKGPPKHEISPYLWMELHQRSSVKLDRLTLGPDADHWGVHKDSDGSFQRFSSVGTRHRFTKLITSKTEKIESNNQIGFVALGFNGDWAFSVNGFVEHRCGQPFKNQLSGGWKARKKVSTVVLSPMARTWIIVWQDGTLSHNLPSNFASEVEDYCQLQHSLKPNGNQSNPRRQKGPKAKPAKPEVYVPPRKYSTSLRLLDPLDWKDRLEYNKIVRLFQRGWKHSNKKCPNIKRIFAVSLPTRLDEAYEAYRESLERQNGWDGINEELLFHGTPRHCSLGEADGYNSLCSLAACSLCSILKTSFLVSKVGSSGRSLKRFGDGIYTSSVSSKLRLPERPSAGSNESANKDPVNRADDYANVQWSSNYKVVIVAKAALGEASVLYRNTRGLTKPPGGCDSVLGEAGIDLNYEEQVLYTNDAIRLAFVVVYERPVSTSGCIIM